MPGTRRQMEALFKGAGEVRESEAESFQNCNGKLQPRLIRIAEVFRFKSWTFHGECDNLYYLYNLSNVEHFLSSRPWPNQSMPSGRSTSSAGAYGVLSLNGLNGLNGQLAQTVRDSQPQDLPLLGPGIFQ